MTRLIERTTLVQVEGYPKSNNNSTPSSLNTVDEIFRKIDLIPQFYPILSSLDIKSPDLYQYAFYVV
jgi:hypothetical protein